MPEGVSAMRGLALPSHPLSETPLVVTAPSSSTGTKSWYSWPAPKVPDATVTGFFMARPPRLTAMFTCAIYHTTFEDSKTGPSTQARRLPSVVSTTQDKQAPTPQAIRRSIDTWHSTWASAAI